LNKKFLFIFVEGNDDKRFFEKIIMPYLKDNYIMEIITYANMKKEKLIKFIHEFEKSPITEYFYFCDLNSSPCITHRKKKEIKKVKNLKPDKTIVVIKEIESWYVSGISNDLFKKLKINYNYASFDIEKDQFNSIIPQKFKNSRISFMIEILNHFSIDIAKVRNKSFKYFMDKLNMYIR